MTEQQESVVLAAKEVGLTVSTDNFALNRQALAVKINELLIGNFQQLISILYRMDVSEAKLRLLLRENPGTDAGLIIADLVIERQAQKIRSRREFRQRDNDISEEEKW
jgi:hypothetical protein